MRSFEKRQEREARKWHRDLEKRAKEQAKLSALEQARFEVAENENALDLLLSVHKEQNPSIDWNGLACSLPPHRPFRYSRHEFAADLALASARTSDQLNSINDARAADDREYEAALGKYDEAISTWQRLQGLTRRVIAGEARAYDEVIAELSPLAEIATLGSSSALTVHSPTLVSYELHVNGRDVVPGEIKSLTSTGKLSVKAMSKARFHDIYQDYVCGCALRVARELFAILPIDIVLVTAHVARGDASDGSGLTVPVLSLALARSDCSKLDFDALDPSDTVATLVHRGDVKASKKTGEFVPITPLLPSDVTLGKPTVNDVLGIRSNVRVLRDSIRHLLSLPPLDDANTNSQSGSPA